MNKATPNKTTLKSDWQFRQVGKQDWLPATVPGCNFTDLLDNQLIEAPFHSDEETRLQWIEEQDWEYQSQFTLAAADLDADQLILEFEGLDTYCSIYLNGVLLGETDNMFVAYEFDIRDQASLGDNHLHLVFHSPIKRTLPIWQANGFTYPAENDKSEERLSVFSRKAPYHFGWDWGPRFVTSGIWRKVNLLTITQARIADIHVKQQHTDDKVTLQFDTLLKSTDTTALTLQISCSNHPELTCSQQVNGTDANLFVDIEHPKLWWPNGLGEAHLYQFNVKLMADGQIVDSKSLNIGLRTVELVQGQDDMGESFYFKVNGHPVFMKGANYIPSDSFLPQVDADKYQRIFTNTVAANMNMLRVWGGGIYEDDRFYQLADEKGILIWQDFMFACTLYPADEAFLDSVAVEAEYNIKRLRNHPCLALWCGNNEIEMGISDWQWPEKFGYSDERYEQLKADYHRLFREHLPALVSQFNPELAYLPSSPISFWETPEDDNKGDNHYWGVWHGELPFDAYRERVPRFMSEYGFQSLPIKASLDEFCPSMEQHIESATMQVHQKHPRGNGIIQKHMLEAFNQPKDFASFAYLSQLLQAQALGVAFAAHRINQPFCMGTLYWQLNDCWPVNSWSGIDYYGRWKALHYQAMHDFKSHCVFIEPNEDNLNLHLVNDALRPVDTLLTYELYDFSGRILNHGEYKQSITASSSVCMATLTTADLVGEHSLSQLVLKVSAYTDGELVDSKLHYFTEVKHLALQPADIKYSAEYTNQYLRVSLSANQLVKGLHLQLGQSRENFSDNFFDLLPEEHKVVTIFAPELASIAPENWLQNLIITSVYDTYH